MLAAWPYSLVAWSIPTLNALWARASYNLHPSPLLRAHSHPVKSYAMPMFVYQRAKRGFVQVIFKVASLYGLVCGINRDSDEETTQAASTPKLGERDDSEFPQRQPESFSSWASHAALC